MRITATKDLSNRKAADCLIIPFMEEKKPIAACVLKDIERDIKGLLDVGDFKGKEKETALIYTQGRKEDRILLLGLGKKEDLTREVLRNALAKAIKRCHGLNLKKINLLYPYKCKLKNLFKTVLEGLYLPNYFFHRLKKQSLKNTQFLIEEVTIVGKEQEKKLIDKMEVVSTAVHMARDLVNNNADDETPQRLAIVARELEKITPRIKVNIFDKRKIQKAKLDLLLAVSRGSFRDPVFIVIEYTANKTKDRTVLIGKGVTYDTGGLCIKPPSGRGGMDSMKSDMAGAASVLGVMYAAAELKLNKNVTAIIPATENAIGSKSYKPGDVYSSYSGKTVEVANTDAEGRLILADAISYAVDKIKPSRIIDIASLTGAITIALGEEIAGVFANDEKLLKGLKYSADETGELLWEMPLHKKYKKMLKSDIADIKNVGGRDAGSITAALFLEEFIKDIPWAHIDVGGTSYYTKPTGYYTTLGTGYGVRLIFDFLENL